MPRILKRVFMHAIYERKIWKSNIEPEIIYDLHMREIKRYGNGSISC